MIKILLKQIWNERKSNAWLFGELLVVFVVLWYVVDWTYTTARTYYEPLGFDIENTYLLRLSVKTDKCGTYDTDTVHTNHAGQDMLEIVKRLRRLPEVEAVAISENARPYTGSNSSISFKVDTLEFGMLKRPVTTDFFQVFRYENVDGTGWQNLAKEFERQSVVVSENFFPKSFKGDRTLLNRRVADLDDTTNVYRIVAVTKKVRYDDFWANYNDRYAAVLMSDEELIDYGSSNLSWLEISLRVKPGTPDDFPEKIMKASDSQYAVGNVFILSVKPYSYIRDTFNLSSVNNVKNRMWMMGFLLVNIFLGIIGTFWFRTQQRRSELGLRIAMGATRRSLWNGLNGEALMLLTIAAIPALGICFYLGYSDITSNWPIEWGVLRFVTGAVITYLLIAAMIVLGIWYPALQVMHIQPADALHEE